MEPHDRALRLGEELPPLATPRIFAGIGKATQTPAALSMLGDAFPVRRLGLAIGVHHAGTPLGMALALISSSLIAPSCHWPVSSWVLGAIGLARPPRSS